MLLGLHYGFTLGHMKWEDAEYLRKTWGDKECSHPDVDKEYFGGMETDYVCTTCGKEFSRAEYLERNGRAWAKLGQK